jgi:single-strand DNA-binding protein
MTAIQTTIVGNLTRDPELKFTAKGAAVAQLSVACNENYKDDSGKWVDGPTSFVNCNAWRELADHAAETLRKGDRVIVTGTFRQRTYETKEGEKRTVWELAISAIGPELRYATAKVSRIQRSDGAPVPEDPWASDAPLPAGPADSEEPPPF